MTIEAVEIDRWQRIAASSGDASLAEGALLIAAEEYQDLDIDGYLQRIDSMGATLRRRLRSDISATEALLALNRCSKSSDSAATPTIITIRATAISTM
jgi:regulator of sirC expression with transglutaminase-like and TPR domain